GVSYTDFYALLRDPAHPEINRQWGINCASLDILRALAERHRITEPDVLPYLIEALDYPTNEVKGQASITLRALTRRAVGYDDWRRGVMDAAKEQAYRRWWRDWWRQNQRKHPLFTLDVAERVEQRVKEAYADIKAELAPKFEELFCLDS